MKTTLGVGISVLSALSAQGGDFDRTELNAMLDRQMIATTLKDKAFDWPEAERLAVLPDFGILDEFRRLKQEVSDELAR